MGHEINKDSNIGCMLSLSGIYPATCKPEDVLWVLMNLRRRSLFYSDIQMLRGKYPSSYFKRIFKENNIQYRHGRPEDIEIN